MSFLNTWKWSGHAHVDRLRTRYVGMGSQRMRGEISVRCALRRELGPCLKRVSSDVPLKSQESLNAMSATVLLS